MITVTSTKLSPVRFASAAVLAATVALVTLCSECVGSGLSARARTTHLCRSAGTRTVAINSQKPCADQLNSRPLVGEPPYPETKPTQRPLHMPLVVPQHRECGSGDGTRRRDHVDIQPEIRLPSLYLEAPLVDRPITVWRRFALNCRFRSSDSVVRPVPKLVPRHRFRRMIPHVQSAFASRAAAWGEAVLILTCRPHPNPCQGGVI